MIKALNHLNRSWRELLAVAGLLCCLSLPVAGQESDKPVAGARFGTMSQGMDALARHIAATLESEGMNQVAIGAFRSDSLDRTTFGPRIVTALKEQLEEEKVAIASAGAWSVSGEYGGKLNRANGKFEIFIKSQLTDQLGEVQSELVTPIVTDEAEALAMLGSTVSLPLATPDASESKVALGLARAEAIAASVSLPKADLAGSVIRATSTSPYGIEVLVGGRPLAATIDQNQPFVDMGLNTQYTIRLINDSDQEAGVTLSIDGINTLAFSKYREPGLWVIPAHKSVEIRGWYIGDDAGSSFVVTELANAPAAQLGATGNIGTITASFCAAFVDDLPPSEPPPGAKGFATGKGPTIEQRVTEVLRQFGVVREAVSVRYSR